MSASDTLSFALDREVVVPEFDVLVVDDDQGLLELLVLGLKATGIRAEGCSRQAEAMHLAETSEPLCVVVDLNMPGVSDLELVSAILAMKRHVVIVLSAYVDVPITVQAMRLGAHDVLRKPITIEALYDAVIAARASLKPSTEADGLGLTKRERQVAELMVKGMTAKQIAQKLDLSPRTIEFFRGNLMRKTQSANAAALASALTRNGFS